MENKIFNKLTRFYKRKTNIFIFVFVFVFVLFITYINLSQHKMRVVNYLFPNNWKMFSPNINTDKINISYECTKDHSLRVIDDISIFTNLSNDILITRTLLDHARLITKKKSRNNSGDKETIKEAQHKIETILDYICTKKYAKKLQKYEIN